MDDLIIELINTGMGQLIDKSRDAIALNNPSYKILESALSDSEERYSNLDLTDEQRKIVDIHLYNLSRSFSLSADFSYFAGIRDTITLLHHLDMIK